MAAIPALIREGVVVFDGVNTKRPEQRLIAIAVKVRIKGENFVVTAGMREDSNGRLFYDHELLDIKRVEDRLSSQSGAAALPGSAPSSASTLLNHYTISFMAQKNSSSKAVDENGEPLVVYQGTTTEISEFDPELTNSPIFGIGTSYSIFICSNNSKKLKVWL